MTLVSTEQEQRDRIREACRNDDTETLSTLLQTNPRLVHNSGSVEEYCYLTECVQHNSLLTLAVLLEHGADVNEKYGSTSPLYKAVWKDSLPATQVLIEAGAWLTPPIGVPKFMLTMFDPPLLAAKSRTMAQFLIQSGADVHCADFSGETVLLAAVSGERYQVVETLLEHGADVNACFHPNSSLGGRSLLSTAAGKAPAAIVDLLLRCGADVNHASSYGVTPIMYALRWLMPFGEPEDCISRVRLLVGAGADIGHRNHKGHGVLDVARASLDNISVEEEPDEHALMTTMYDDLVAFLGDKDAMQLERLRFRGGILWSRVLVWRAEKGQGADGLGDFDMLPLDNIRCIASQVWRVPYRRNGRDVV